jgi:hypothetical protein
VSVNSYWVSPFPDELDWEHPLPFNTPQSAFADYTALQDLAPPTLDVADQHETSGSENRHTVTVTNRGTGVAFQVHLEIHRSTDGEEVLPVLWEDGYFLLLPGESRTVAATYQASDLAGGRPGCHGRRLVAGGSRRASADQAGQRADVLLRVAQRRQVDAEDRGQRQPDVVGRAVGRRAVLRARQRAAGRLDELAPLDARVSCRRTPGTERCSGCARGNRRPR